MSDLQCEEATIHPAHIWRGVRDREWHCAGVAGTRPSLVSSFAVAPVGTPAPPADVESWRTVRFLSSPALSGPFPEENR